MRILIVTYSYAPAVNARAFRWTAIAEYWAAQGHVVDVIVAWAPARARSETRNGVTIHRVGGRVAERLRALLNRAGPHAVSTTGGRQLPSSFKQSIFAAVMRGMKWLHDRTWKRVYWPDSACLWYFAAKRKARTLLREGDFDALITSSLPFTDHLVGKALMWVKPDIVWLADIGDPFCFLDLTPHNNPTLYRRLNYYADESVFNSADVLSVTTEQTRDCYVQLFPQAENRLHVLGPLLLPSTKWQKKQVFPSDGITRLVYVGTLYRTIRNPEPILEFFSELLRQRPNGQIELHFFGTINDCGPCFDRYPDLLGKRIFLHGVVDRDTALSALQDATALINIGNDTKYQLPSKVLEYAASGRPLINVVKDDSDSSVEALRAHPACLMLFKDSLSRDAQATAVGRFIDQAVGDYSDRLDWLKAYETPSIADQYMALLQSASPRRKAQPR